ncbi:MAG: amidase [Hydrogenophilaceae bacterium]|nr:amidase [Hydrogenophilaceae bacterium]
MIENLVAKRVSARELLDAHVARCEAVNPKLNAVVATDLDRARREAQAIDDARARGEALGPLAGLPMTVKDCFDVDGLPSVAGNPAFADRPKACPDADVVKTARAAGAIVWGKTNVPLMASDVQSFNAVYGTTNNPYDLARTPGGSSGGAAAALAAHITPLEIGSDIGGSLRHPANFCGVASLKPTWGRLSLDGHVPPPPGVRMETDLAVSGPMARDIADLRLFYDVLRGAPSPTRSIKGARIALWTDEPEFPLAADVRAAIEDAGAALARQGAAVTPIAAPVDVTQLMDSYFTILISIISAGLPEPIYAAMEAARPASLEAMKAGASRYSQAGYIVASTPPYRDVAAARYVRQTLKDRVAGFFAEGWDAILAPISTVPAFPHDHEPQQTARRLACDGRAVEYLHILDWIALATALHLPAVAAPVSRTRAGLPIGAQIITRWDDEARALDLAEALEREIGALPQPAL